METNDSSLSYAFCLFSITLFPHGDDNVYVSEMYDKYLTISVDTKNTY